MRRLLALVLTVGVLLSVGAIAVSSEEIAYVFPDDWSRPALMFAVENGILAGDENHNLNPKKNITRAEIAAVLVRMLGAKEQADLSAYTDVDPDAWYFQELSAAVAAGIFNGVSEAEMQPNAPLTREQAVVVLFRAFGLVAPDTESYRSFSDYKTISGYAQAAAGAMAAQGFLSGYEDGSLRPKNHITRAEVAQLIYNIFDCIADTPEQLPEQGAVLYRGTKALPDDLKLDGSLVIGQAYTAPLSQAAWDVAHTISIRCAKAEATELSHMTCENLVFAPCKGDLKGDFESLHLGGAVDYVGNTDNLTLLNGTITADGAFQKVETMAGASAILKKDIAHGLTVRANSTVTLEGSVSTVTVEQQAKAVIHGRVETLNLDPYATARTVGEVGAVTLGYGCRWTLDGPANDLKISEDNVHLTVNNRVKSVYAGARNVRLDGTGSVGTLYYVGSTACSVSCDIQVFLKDLDYHLDYIVALDTVKTHRIPYLVVQETVLYAREGGYGEIYTLPVGTTVYLEHWPDGGWLHVSLADSTWGWVRAGTVAIDYAHVHINGNLDYSTATKEGYVNQKNYSSDTEYLIWVSLFTQKVIVFRGAQGSWVVIKTFPCSTGSLWSPTPRGVYRTQTREAQWNFSDYYVTHVTRYDNAFAFHSTTFHYNGEPYDFTIGSPASHGCVRSLPEDNDYIFYNIPLGSTVVIY